MLGRKQTNILVIKTDSLTGFVVAEPAFEAIRSTHPNSKISLLTIPPLQRIARASPYFDQVAAIPSFREAEAKRDFIKQLKTAKFERVYDLSGDDAGKKLYSAMGMFRPKWFTAAPGKKSRGKRNQPEALPRFENMLSEAGVEFERRLPDFRWAIEARKDSANMKPAWYGVTSPFGLLLPSQDEVHRWSSNGYAGLASLMAHTGYMPVLAGAKELHAFGDAIAHDAPQMVDLTGKTDHLQLAALAREAAFFVSDDAEEVNLAVSVGCQGILIAGGKAVGAAPEGRHVVTLRYNEDPGSVTPDFIWRTLTNMGLVRRNTERMVNA